MLRAIESENRADPVMADFANVVLPDLFAIAVGQKVDNNNESLSSRILNGLFPVNKTCRYLQKNLEIEIFPEEIHRRILISALVLSQMDSFERILCNRSASNRETIDIICRKLSLDRFLSPEDPDAYKVYLVDILAAINLSAQSKIEVGSAESRINSGTLQAVFQDLLGDGITFKSTLPEITLVEIARFLKLANLLREVSNVSDALSPEITVLLDAIGSSKLKLSYHKIAENKGILTNIVNNSLIKIHTDLNTEARTYYSPLLYLSTGAIYLAKRDAPPVEIKNLPELVVASIKSLCVERLIKTQTGFDRDGKGIKYAEYYQDFFDDIDLMRVAQKAVNRILPASKPSIAKDRSKRLIEFQQKGILGSEIDLNLDNDIRCDRLAEFGDVITRKIWGEKVKKIAAEIKKQKKKGELLPPIDLYPEDFTIKIAEYLQLSDYLPQIREIQRINDTLKEKKVKGNTGGVPYEWYYLAAKYLARQPGISDSDLEVVCDRLVDYAAELIKPIAARYQLADGWDDLRKWVALNTFTSEDIDTAKIANLNRDRTNLFLKELNNYKFAKKIGRGKRLICSISNSPYTVTEQTESAVLFTPQVYTNKQTLGGADCKRNISSIEAIEMMLRKVLMNQNLLTGRKFEESKYTYLYFYPTYYFTPETNKFLALIYSNLAQNVFTVNLSKQIIKHTRADLSRENYQSLDTFLIDEEIQVKNNLTQDDPSYQKARILRVTYPEDLPMNFYFMAIPPGRDATDTSSWIMPTWLSLVLPLVIDVKITVSSSCVRLFQQSSDFSETVILDAPPLAIRTLLKGDRLELDELHERLNRLTVACIVHLNLNSKSGTKFKPNWGKFIDLARDLTSCPLYLFAYLQKEERKKGSITIAQLERYLKDFYPSFDPLVKYEKDKDVLQLDPQSPLAIPMGLANLAGKFYYPDRRKRSRSEIIRPIARAASALLLKDTRPEIPQKLVELARQFYRPDFQNPTIKFTTSPVDFAVLAIHKSKGEVKIETIINEIERLMDLVRAGSRRGFCVVQDRHLEKKRISEFARYFIEELFIDKYKGEISRLKGRELLSLRQEFNFYYRLKNDSNAENPLVIKVAASLKGLIDKYPRSQGGFIHYTFLSQREKMLVILDFARYFVTVLFEGQFRGDASRFSTREFTLICDAYYYLDSSIAYSDYLNKLKKKSQEESEKNQNNLRFPIKYRGS